jgi:hypothetical protein
MSGSYFTLQGAIMKKPSPTLEGFIPTTQVDDIVRNGTPEEVAEVVKNYELSYPLLVAALLRKDLPESIKSRIRKDIRTIYARVYPEE